MEEFSQKSSPIPMILSVVALVLVIAVGAGLFFINQMSIEKFDKKMKIIENNLEEHGEILSRMGTFLDNVDDQVQALGGESADNSVTDEDVLIKTAVYNHLDVNYKDATVSVQKSNGVYALGGVAPVPAGPGGGMFLAAKIDGTWQVLWDGNGTISCKIFEDHPNYPTSYIDECYDPVTDKSVKR